MTSLAFEPIFRIVFPPLRDIAIYAGCGVVVFLAVLLWAVCLLLVWRALQKKQEAVYPVKLASGCNLPTVFQLRVELGELRKAIAVACKVNRRRLPVKTIHQVQTITEELPVYPAKAAETPAPKTVAVGDGVKSARQKAQSVNAFASVLASIASGLAAILPGSLKTPFREFASGIRTGQQSVREVTAEPERMAASARSLKGTVQRIDKTTGKAISVPIPAAQPRAAVATVAVPAAAPIKMGVTQRVVMQPVQVIETFPFQPGQAQVCRLAFRPRNPLRSYAGSFQIFSQPVELDDFPSAGVIKAQSLTSPIQIHAAPVIYVVTAAILCAGMLAFNTWWALTLIQWLLEFLKHA